MTIPPAPVSKVAISTRCRECGFLAESEHDPNLVLVDVDGIRKAHARRGCLATLDFVWIVDKPGPGVPDRGPRA